MQLSNEKSQANGHVYVISAPSGGGKTTLVEALMAQDSNVTRAVTHTTRGAREGEENGVDYHFVTKDQFREMIQNEDFLEHAEVFDNLYGTSLAEVRKHTATGKDVVLVIDWQGAASVKAMMPEAQLIFVIPPSIAELEARLSARKQDDPEIVKKRMADAMNQIRHYEKFDYVIINDDFKSALQDLSQIFKVNRLRTHYQKSKNQPLLDDLLGEKI
ncbi:guanylate kinase [Ignatzschineria rhizosphaerae]|uniref:Guanylate kinase n=1 Tax=Ignatzschineria rhizosphaerae TaxID=2923279 RepID=A0ABY3X346_9GAMM|nr:guanylate kinase [Ignatzschineria rhizosphaerae]UNM96124.1 guanylate kinase [Ignatzschineria rhizosphaerae]